MIELLKTTRQVNPFLDSSDDYDPTKPLPTYDAPPSKTELMNKLNEVIEKLNSIS